MLSRATTDVRNFRESLIEGAFAVEQAAYNGGYSLDRALLVSAMHFMHEVELVHAVEVDDMQLHNRSYDPEEVLEAGATNARRGELIDFLWHQIRSGNDAVIEGVAKLEMEHIAKHGVSSYTPTHDLGRADARLYSLEGFANLNVPDVVPKDA